MKKHTPGPWTVQFNTIQTTDETIADLFVNNNGEYNETDAQLISLSPKILELIKALADQYTGRDPLALMDTDPGQWAEELLAQMENREPEDAAE